MASQKPDFKDPSLIKTQAYVNGKWVDAKSGKTFAVTDPSTDAEIAQVAEFDGADTAEAIEHAKVAFAEFKKTTGRERANMLLKWLKLCQESAEDLAKIISWENGKSLAEAKGEVAYGLSFFQWFAEEAPRHYGDVIPSGIKGNRVFTMKQPVGVVGLITPWNFPLAMFTRKVGAAVAAGCTTVLKPGGETPLTALAIAELGHRAGIPAGVFNVVTTLANTPEVGKEITTNPTIRKISFTGSTGVGRLLMSQAASTIKKCSFELGGNAPFIVFDDADLEKAVPAAITCKFRGTGQTCVCANRIYVQEGIHDAFVSKLTEAISKIKLGPGLADGTTHGPLIHGRAVDKVEELLKDATDKGGKVVTGGQRRKDIGPNFFDPTLVTGCTPDMKFNQDEIFGPVAPVYKFKTEGEVIALANSAEVGLAGYFFSENVGRIWRVSEALEVGMVGANTGLISDSALPFGGVKQSGLGREGSKYGLEDYTVIKAVTLGGLGL
ncbi:succinate semialdehyde dehydrogenase NADP+ linked [Savitreella phatthalungensis]